uniref:Uncharacterized protein n=1 Tax=Parascaris equorum TaxID=6256 RepID=A0A914RWT9_PAREQ
MIEHNVMDVTHMVIKNPGMALFEEPDQAKIKLVISLLWTNATDKLGNRSALLHRRRCSVVFSTPYMTHH